MVESFLSKYIQPKYLVKIALVVLVYYVSAKLGLSLASSVKQVSLVWPPTGISLAILLIFGIDLWPGVLIGAFISDYSTMLALPIALATGTGNTLEALVGAYLLKTFGFSNSFTRIKDVLLFVFFAVILSTAIAATIGTASLIYGGISNWSNYFQVWLNWWAGDLISDIVIAPLILAWSSFKQIQFKPFRFLEGVALFIILAFSSVVLLTGFIVQIPAIYQGQYKYLLFPFIIWAAYRFKQKGSSLAIFFVFATSIFGVITKTGPFVNLGNPETGFLFLGSFIISMALTYMFFSAAISERDMAESEVSKSEQRFKSLIENSADIIILTDAVGNITYVSQSAEKALGYKPEELVGISGFKIIYADDIPATAEKLKALLANPGKHFSLENRLILKDGKVHWMEAEGVNLLSDPTVGAIVINFRDINDKKQLDQVKGEFVSLSAHQLRSPLSVLRWGTESLMKEKTFPEGLRSDLNDVYSSVLTMNDTVNLLLDVSRFELGKVQISSAPVELPEIFKVVLSEKQRLIDVQGISVKNSTVEKIPIITGDAKLIGVVIENLFGNAIKYTPRGGVIDINFSVEPNFILFKIKDNGIGIPVDDQAKIFTKLFRGSNVKKVQPSGLGLGLYLVKLILNMMGGKIWFESKGEGTGTAFFVEFPKDVRIKNR